MKHSVAYRQEQVSVYRLRSAEAFLKLHLSLKPAQVDLLALIHPCLHIFYAYDTIDACVARV
jgi:hypothetical protein